MKKLAIGFAVLIVVLTGAILVVPGFLDWNEYKTQIEETASAYSGRTVTIKGDISLSLLPTSALSARDVSVTNLKGGQAEYMLSLKSLDVKVSFPSVISSLFGGRIKVEKFILVDPVIALEVLKDGRVNWNLTGSSDEAGQTASSADISFDKFQIVNGQVSFENLSTGNKELLRKINANVKVKSIIGPFEVDGSAKYRGLDGELSVDLGKNRPGRKMPVALKLALLDGRIKADVTGGMIVSGRDSSFSGKMSVTASDAGDLIGMTGRLKGRKSPATVSFGQDFAFDTVFEAEPGQVTVSDLNIRMGQSRGQGKAEISFGDRINFLGDLTLNKLDLDKLLTVFSQQEKSGQRPESKPSGDRSPRNISARLVKKGWLSRFSGKADIKLGALKYNGKIASQIAVKLLASDGAVDISTIQARMPGGSRLSFTGQITEDHDRTPVVSGNISVNASNLRGLLSWLKLDVRDIPSGQLAQFSVKSGLKLTPDLLQLFALKGRLDAMSFGGGLSYALGGRPSYGISLDIANLNLDSYRERAGRKAAQESDFGRSLAQLDEFDARYRIGLSNVTLHGLKVRSGKLEGLLLGGRLEAKLVKLTDIAGVNLVASGRGRNFSSNPELDIKLSAKAKSLTSLKRTLVLEKILDPEIARSLKPGKMTLDGSLSTSFEKMDIDLKSRFGPSRFNVRGTVRSATLKKFPDIGSADLDIDSRSTSLAALIDQFDLPLRKPRAQDDRPLHIKGRLKTSADLVDVDGRINIAAGEILLKGRRKGSGRSSSVDMMVDLQGPETRDFIRGLGIDFQPSVRKLGPIAVKFKLTGSGDQYALSNVVGDVGPVKLSGAGKIDLQPEKPYFDFNLKAGEIPLHDFLKKNPAKAKKTPAKKFGAWNRRNMDLSLLSAYNGRADISAASLRYNGYVFENPVFEVVLKNGILSVNNFTGRLFGGEVALSGNFGSASAGPGSYEDGGTPKMDINIILKQASLSRATRSAAGVTPMTGFFDLSGKFRAAGKSQYDMISSLSGKGRLVAGPGMISGVDIPALGNRLSDMDSNNAFASLLGTVLSGGETSYKGGMSNIVAKDGRISFSPFDIELDGATSTVKMDLDLLKWTIHSKGQMFLAGHPDAPPVGIIIAGNISRPDVIYKTDRLKKYVGAKVASHMLQKLVGEEGSLEGIFGKAPVKKNPVPATRKKPASAAAPAAQQDQPVAKAAQQPAPKPKPVEEFGKRLLQKLFQNKKKDPNEGDSPP